MEEGDNVEEKHLDWKYMPFCAIQKIQNYVQISEIMITGYEFLKGY